jgi:SAM-dependent methyltransferase
MLRKKVNGLNSLQAWPCGRRPRGAAIDKRPGIGYFGAMPGKPWQVRLFAKSLMKKEKARLVRRRVDFTGRSVLDLGVAQGTVSYQLKKTGGEWLHADLDLENLLAARPLVGSRLCRIDGRGLPCRDEAFDLVLALDILEHVTDDAGLLAECRRSLRPGGRIVVSTPVAGERRILNRWKRRLGLTPEKYGHKRPGYDLPELRRLLESGGFAVRSTATYARFFTAFFETLLDWHFMRKKKKTGPELRTGAVLPQSAADLDRSPALFWIYGRLVYPLVWLATRLDRLLPAGSGYATLVVAEKK